MELRRVLLSRICAGFVLVACLIGTSLPVHAEWFVAAQVGANFADPIRNARGTGTFAGQDLYNFNLLNSPAFGLKVGVFPNHGVLGLELDASYSNPHIKNFNADPGIHLSVANIGAHVLLRYPGVTWQPYIGGGPALLVARLGRSTQTESDTQTSFGTNLLAGVRAFVTPTVAVFTEYKYTDSTFHFGSAFGPAGGFEGTYRGHELFAGLSYHF